MKPCVQISRSRESKRRGEGRHAHEYLGETAASDHNLYVRGNYVYESNYVAGLRIIDISYPANPKEAGSFDTVSATSSRRCRLR